MSLSAYSAANLSTLLARSTPSTGSRGWGSQATVTTSLRDKPSSADHRATTSVGPYKGTRTSATGISDKNHVTMPLSVATMSRRPPLARPQK
ncbi:hypothetical protein Taro_006290 [Colocasia esculenta]|uniref:Uncharacterized protein n=1 Tax=Colocasia esculenta TaxID=4460 RepID=A0A843TWW5_COLES|nr:hypothetical protein [Colocasia esculenta]